jgi:hypothetical protein
MDGPPRGIEALLHHAWQTANLKRIREYPVTKTTPIVEQPLGSASRSFFDPERNVVYAAVRSIGRMGYLAAIHLDTGKVEHLEDIKGAAIYYVSSLTYDAKGRRIFYSSDHGNWRDLNVYDLKTRQARRIVRDSRIGDLVYSPADDALWGVRHHNGLATLGRFPPPYNAWQDVSVFQYGSDFFDLDISPDGRYLTGALADLTGHATLVRAEVAALQSGNQAFETLHDFEFATPGNFVHSHDGKYLYGSSYYTGVSNLWRYDLQARKAEILSNGETGLFRPLPFPDGRLMAYEYTAKGFTPVFVDARPLQDVNAIQYLGQATVEKHPQLREWKLPPPSRVNLAALKPVSGLYAPWKGLERSSIFPIVQGYKGGAAVGVRAAFADRLGISALNATLSYSPGASLAASERVHLGFDWKLWNFKVSGYYNHADFYDLFGPTKSSRKGYAVAVENSYNLLYDTPKRVDFTWAVAGYGGMDRLPDAQNVAVSAQRFLSGKLGLKSESVERSLGSVDEEKGVKWSLNARGIYTGPRLFPRLYGTLDRGFILPRRTSLWLRGSGGKAVGNPSNPFANFYFGGFGNNWVDHQEISRYRQYYSFPGVELNGIAASNFAKGLVEWNLPPVRFKRLGTTAIYCNWARLSLFSSGLFTNLATVSNRGVYGNVGAQLDFRIMIFTWLNSTFSTGYAVAADRNGRVGGEYMVSLKIL